MIERIESGFHPFVLPFLLGMAFVLGYCMVGMIRVVSQLSTKERRKFLRSLINPSKALKNIKDIFLNCLIHTKLWKKHKLLGFMHSSIAFGWFMLIVIGHIQVLALMPKRITTFYYPIFFNFFVIEVTPTHGLRLFAFLMDFFLALVLCGIILAMVKRLRSRLFGMRRTTRPSLTDLIGLYSLWAIFPLRLLAEGFTAHISGGSFLTIPLNWFFRTIVGNEVDMVLPMLSVWWAYSIALCVFMVILPFSRYMHIPAEILLIPLRNAGIKVTDARKGFTKVMVLSCPGCGVCIDACPMSVKKANTRDATVYLNRQLRRNNDRRIEQISDKCLLCGKCSAVCQIGVDATGLRIAQRARRKYAIEQNYGNIRADYPTSQCKVLYFGGCMTALMPRISQAVESLLCKAGVDYQFLDKNEGICCGRPLILAGRIAQAEQLIEKNREAIINSGCDTLLLSCPICYKIFKEQYKLEGIRVVHYSEYFNELMAQGVLDVKAGSEVFVFHDPCALGRESGIYKQPREVVSRVGTLVEAKEHHQGSICCGGSLGSLSLSFAQREAITRNSLDNLTTNNPSKIVTACPLCQSTFSRYSEIPVVDIAEIIDASISASK